MYKLGDRILFEDKLHGHDSRTIRGIIADIDTRIYGPDSPHYRIEWDEGGCDWLFDYEFKLDSDVVYLAQVHWNITTTIGTNRGNAIVGLYRSVNTAKVIDEMMTKVTNVTGANIDRSRVHGHTANDGSLEVAYSVGGCNIIGFVSKMPIND